MVYCNRVMPEWPWPARSSVTRRYFFEKNVHLGTPVSGIATPTMHEHKRLVPQNHRPHRKSAVPSLERTTWGHFGCAGFADEEM